MRETGAIRKRAIIIFTAQDTTRDGRVRQQTHLLLPASLRQFILEAPIIETKVILDRFKSRNDYSEFVIKSPAKDLSFSAKRN